MPIRKKTFCFKSLIALTLLLVGCTGPTSSSVDPTTIDTSSDETTSTSEETSWSSDDTTSEEPTTPSQSETTDEQTSSEQDTSSTDTTEESSSSSIIKKERFQIIGINDFHGACTPESTSSRYTMGLAKLSTFISEKSKDITTFVISAGDMWQGSIESNSNYGNYVTEAMNIMNFDCMTIGNHEFDWGIDKIYANLEIANFPFLGGNIYYKNEYKIIDNIRTSTIIEKDGIKLGVIGMIGENQYKSITHEFVKDLDFVPYDELIISEAEDLKNNGADFIVLSVHEDWGEGTVANSLDSPDIIAVEKKKVLDSGLIDLVLHAHAHSYSKWTYNNIPLLRAVCNGQAYDICEVSLENGEAAIENAEVNWFTSSDYSNLKDDQRIVNLYNEKYDVEEYAKTVIGRSNGYMSTVKFSKFSAEALYYGITELDYYKDVDLLGAFTNNARKSIYQGEVTIKMIWEAIPFDDEMLIMELKGSTIKQCYTVDEGYLTLSTQAGIYPFGCCDNIIDTETYKILVIDYLGYKIKEEDLLSETIHTGRYLRDLVISYIEKIGTIDASKY